jgi:CrcB protein
LSEQEGFLVKLLYFALAGGAGTLSRYGLSLFIQRFTPGIYPWGTSVVNILGCFLYGMVWSLADQRGVLSPETRAILLTGFMGAFTTFSTFIFETNGLLTQAVSLSLVNLCSQVILGWLAMVVGLKVGAGTL